MSADDELVQGIREDEERAERLRREGRISMHVLRTHAENIEVGDVIYYGNWCEVISTSRPDDETVALAVLRPVETHSKVVTLWRLDLVEMQSISWRLG